MTHPERDPFFFNALPHPTELFHAAAHIEVVRFLEEPTNRLTSQSFIVYPGINTFRLPELQGTGVIAYHDFDSIFNLLNIIKDEHGNVSLDFASATIACLDTRCPGCTGCLAPTLSYSREIDDEGQLLFHFSIGEQQLGFDGWPDSSSDFYTLLCGFSEPQIPRDENYIALLKQTIYSEARERLKHNLALQEIVPIIPAKTHPTQ